MATSPSHKFGQIIGDLLEAAIEPLLADFARRHGLYLDRMGARPARTGRKVTWLDQFGNAHDLDFVMERGGTDEHIGQPVAFIETAWRRYTKHSRNKAQEIQAAILPLVMTHRHAAPFVGVVLAGVFTHGALEQLRSQQFQVLYFPYEVVATAFLQVGIDATFDESTADAEFRRKVRAWEKLQPSDRIQVANALVTANATAGAVREFIAALERAVTRSIVHVTVLPLHGRAVECTSVCEAIRTIEQHDEAGECLPVVKYEIVIRYGNGDKITAEFVAKEGAIEFLRNYAPPDVRPANPAEIR
jgi:hypothetical protein